MIHDCPQEASVNHHQIIRSVEPSISIMLLSLLKNWIAEISVDGPSPTFLWEAFLAGDKKTNRWNKMENNCSLHNSKEELVSCFMNRDREGQCILCVLTLFAFIHLSLFLASWCCFLCPLAETIISDESRSIALLVVDYFLWWFDSFEVRTYRQIGRQAGGWIFFENKNQLTKYVFYLSDNGNHCEFGLKRAGVKWLLRSGWRKVESGRRMDQPVMACDVI